MRKDISQWCRACLTCANRGIGQPVKPLLTPIPVDGPFDKVGVDVVKMPKKEWQQLHRRFYGLSDQVA